MSGKNLDYQKALVDPSEFFKDPADIIVSTELDREQKIELLRRWETDARILDVAKEENMRGGEQSRLADVLKALRALGVRDDEESGPTKSGG